MNKIFENRMCMFALTLVLALVSFLCADPNSGIPQINIAGFAFTVSFIVVAFLQFGKYLFFGHPCFKECVFYTFLGALVGTGLGWLLFLLF